LLVELVLGPGEAVPPRDKAVRREDVDRLDVASIVEVNNRDKCREVLKFDADRLLA
jgi:hypothetical protein